MSSRATERTQHDLICVNTVLDFLGVECLPNIVLEWVSLADKDRVFSKSHYLVVDSKNKL